MGAHPTYDDQGTCDWHVDLEEALREAAQRRLLLFVLVWRRRDADCKALIENQLPRPKIKALLQEHFVALAIDADELDEKAMALVATMGKQDTLPLVLCVDPRGQMLGGLSGEASAPALQKVLEEAIDPPEVEPPPGQTPDPPD